jgi:beta-galactosidase
MNTLLLLGCVLFTTETTPTNGDELRVRMLLNEGWRFKLGADEGAATAPADTDWEAVSIPHTWNARDGQDGGNDYKRGPAWYRHELRLPASNGPRRWFLRFDAANIVTDVYIDGAHVGQHRGGYAAFCFDITSFASPDKAHLLAVRVDNSKFDDVPPLSADYTFCGGIYRDVELIGVAPVCVSPLDFGAPGVALRQRSVTADAAEIDAVVMVANLQDEAARATVHVRLHDAAGQVAAESRKTMEVPPRVTLPITQSLKVDHPHLWDAMRDPYLYRAEVTIHQDETVTDRVVQPLGLRYFRVDPDKGFFLNGRPLDLHGANLHQDRFNHGWATTADQRREDLALLRDMGCSMVRLAHYQHADDVYTACDTLGLIVWTELGLVNEVRDTPAFRENAAQQLTELIRQNQNHPSVLFWGIQNEVTAPWIKNTPDPGTTIAELAALAKREDPTRLTVCAATDPLDHPANTQTDLTALNRYFGWYWGETEAFGEALDNYHTGHPQRPVGISEYGAGASIAHHEDPPPKPKHDGPWHPEEWQAQVHEGHWLAMRERPYLWCKLVWNMFDFASDGRREGDAPGINDKGLVTGDRRVPKDSYFWYKSQWSGEPFVHITSRRFTPRTTSPVTVKIYSNCPEAELFVNGESRGTQPLRDGIARWENTELKPGENVIRVIARREKAEYTDECRWEYQPKN